MNPEDTLKDLDEIYKDYNPNRLFMCYLTWNVPQSLIINFGTAYILSDEYGNIRSKNLIFSAKAINLVTDTDTFTEKNTGFQFITKLIAFTKMFKRAGIDIRPYIQENKSFAIEFQIKSKYSFKLTKMFEIKP